MCCTLYCTPHEPPAEWLQVYKGVCKTNGADVAIKKLDLDDFPIGSKWVRLLSASASVCLCSPPDAQCDLEHGGMLGPRSQGGTSTVLSHFLLHLAFPVSRSYSRAASGVSGLTPTSVPSPMAANRWTIFPCILWMIRTVAATKMCETMLDPFRSEAAGMPGYLILPSTLDEAGLFDAIYREVQHQRAWLGLHSLSLSPPWHPQACSFPGPAVHVTFSQMLLRARAFTSQLLWRNHTRTVAATL
jgi:hypothetical protein